ncbi:hypothetical protein [Marinobacter salicampi]|uniref:hypothetical protein n=1 Tax=Marinobacter salicampi TaxID=435907 RepID=UPI00140D2A61|nr:hypothetical protein [Marinobacter salicampi]
MNTNVIALNGVRLSTPVERETPNYTVYTDGTIRVTRRAMELYGQSSHRLGIDIRQIRTWAQMKDLQIRSWELTLQDLSEDDRVTENDQATFLSVLGMGRARG